MNKILRFLLLPLCFLITCAHAEDRWSINIAPETLYGDYASSPVREKIYSEGALVDLQYLERCSVLFGYFPLQLYYKNNIPTLYQTTNYLSYRDVLTPDFLSGVLTLRLDGYKIQNNDRTHETDGVNVVSPLISYINYDKTYYLDFGYATSRYGESHIGRGGLQVSQYTPTVGLGFNDSTNWMRFRVYDIHTSDYIRSQDVTHTDGLEITLSHYILYCPFYIPKRIDAGFFIGKRIYAVDSDALIVNNLGDIQKGGVYLQAQWRLSQHVDFLVNGGHQSFTTLINNNRVPYALNYVYAGITVKI